MAAWFQLVALEALLLTCNAACAQDLCQLAEPAHTQYYCRHLKRQCRTHAARKVDSGLSDVPLRLLLCLGFATTPSCTVCVFTVGFLPGAAACLLLFRAFGIGGGAESTTGDRVRNGVGDGNLTSTSIRCRAASRKQSLGRRNVMVGTTGSGLRRGRPCWEATFVMFKVPRLSFATKNGTVGNLGEGRLATIP